MSRQPVVAYVGVSGTGKTFAMLRRALERPRVVLINPELTPSEGAPEGFELVTLRRAAELIHSRRRTFRVAVDVPRYCNPALPEESRARVADLVNALAVESFKAANARPEDDRLHLTLAVDEWGTVWTEGGANRRPMPEPVAAILNRGRKRRVSLLLASQRFAHFHPDARAQFAELHLFRQVDFNDLAQIRRERGAVVADRVSSLPNYHRLRVDTSTGGVEHVAP